MAPTNPFSESVQAELKDVRVQTDGYVICPRCHRKVNCGHGGLTNLVTQHWRSKKCKEAAITKNRTTAISSFFPIISKTTAATYVPSRVKTPPPVLTAPSTSSAKHMTNLCPPQSPCLAPGRQYARQLLNRLRTKIESMPDTIPLSANGDKLHEFVSGDFTVNSPAEAWEVLDPALNRIFGYGTTAESAAAIIRRGDYGMSGVVRIMEIFVENYEGIDGALLEGKIQCMVEAIEHACVAEHTPSSCPVDSLGMTLSSTSATGTRGLIVQSASSTMISSCSTPVSPLTRDTNNEREIIYVETNSPPLPARRRRKGCIGVKLQAGVGVYPFLRHEEETLPWDVEVRHGEVFVRSHACSHSANSAAMACDKCELLLDNRLLVALERRAREGVPENAPLRYHGYRGLKEIARRKTVMIDELRLSRLNQGRHVLHLEGVVKTHKELIVAIARGRTARVDRILQMCIRRGAGAGTMIAMVYQASAGLYHPKSYDEEDHLKGLLLWRLGGTRVAGIAHRIFGTPAISTLRQNASVAKFIASPAAPTVIEVQANLEAGIEAIKDLLGVLDKEEGILHAIAMWDEIKTEKRPRWCEKTNKFLGVCRECQGAHGTEFSCRADLEGLFDEIERGEVHLASEATVGAIGLLSSDTRLYSARPVLISGSCKNETAEAHAKVLQVTIDGINSRKSITRARIISLASDGEARRGKALIQLTFKYTLPTTSPIYPLLSPLHLLDLHVGEDDITADKDYKHVAFKRIRNAVLREKGVLVLGIYVTPSVVRKHLKDAGRASNHVEAILNASDKQDVELAYLLEHDLASLPPADSSQSEIYVETREALRLFGTLCYHLTVIYTCVDLTLDEQLEHASSAAHMLLPLFKHNNAKGKFLPTQLLIDLMLMIKNLFFCVAKAKVDRPRSNFYAILLGTDRVETLFGILRTMVGNDSNLDVLQLALRATGTIEVANILANHPEWDRSPRRLRIPVLARDGQPVPNVDHISPRIWRGD
ncbi:hypothetical protein GGF50DRAFT_68089, partial [Schizophyllum commune]